MLFDPAAAHVRRMWGLWTAHYKKYRQILSADNVHVTRPGQNGGAIETSLHANATAQEGFANFFNPKPAAVTKLVQLPVYYAGRERCEHDIGI